ncbi:MAG TPA: hypothetical protein PLP48_00400 [Acholeplasmataceae bacterium]|nr:hypothetical protein [Acholeplasmataceae bacterium]
MINMPSDKSKKSNMSVFYVFLFTLAFFKFYPLIQNDMKDVFDDIYTFLNDAVSVIVLGLLALELVNSQQSIELNKKQIDMLVNEEYTNHKANIIISMSGYKESRIFALINVGKAPAYNILLKVINRETGLPLQVLELIKNDIGNSVYSEIDSFVMVPGSERRLNIPHGLNNDNNIKIVVTYNDNSSDSTHVATRDYWF